MEIKNNYLVFNKSELKIKRKIPARIFVGLCGFDNFKSREDYLLMLHELYDETVDDKFLKRGNFAEGLIKRCYERDGRCPTTYNKVEINWDNFKNIKVWGGLIDIELPLEQTLVEVKSKSIDKYDYIDRNPPKSEVYQGLFYAYHRGYPKCIMEWVFFTPLQEDAIFNGDMPSSLHGMKRISKEFEVDRPHMTKLLQDAEKFVMDFRLNPKVPIASISPDILQAVINKAKGVNKDE